MKVIPKTWFAVLVAVATCCGCLAALLWTSIYSSQHLLVTGSSMCPTLWGPWRQFSCKNCDWTTRTAEIGQLTSASPICFRCGHRDGNRLSELFPGDQAQLDRRAYWFSGPERNDLIAIEKKQGGLQVKRVVGLAGDTVKIDWRGQVFVNEQSWRPPLLLNQLDLEKPGIEVYQHSDTLGDDSRLELAGAWLIYKHINVHNRRLPDVIRDDYPANLRLRRIPLPVEHLFVSLKVQAEVNSSITIVCVLAEEPQAKQVELKKGINQIVMEFDQATWTVIHGEEKLPESNVAQSELKTLQLSPERPVAIRLPANNVVALKSFWLGRGVRFDPPNEYKKKWEEGVLIPEGHIIVLGDNSPASEDSRENPDGISMDQVVGRIRVNNSQTGN